MNRKGIIVAPLVWAILAVTLSTYSFLPGTRATFQAKKAVTMCEATGSLDCDAMVASWSKTDILAYIKDDGITGNGGNFVGGYMN